METARHIAECGTLCDGGLGEGRRANPFVVVRSGDLILARLRRCHDVYRCD